MRENVQMLRGKRQHKWSVVKRCLALCLTSIRKAKNYKLISEHTGIDCRYLRKYASQEIDNDHHVNQLLTKKRRSDAIDQAVVERIEARYDLSSSFIPDKKAVSSKTLELKKNSFRSNF